MVYISNASIYIILAYVVEIQGVFMCYCVIYVCLNKVLLYSLQLAIAIEDRNK